MRKYKIKKNYRKIKIYRRKVLSIIVALFCIISLYVGYMTVSYLNRNQGFVAKPAEPPFTKKEVSLDDLLKLANEKNLSIHLPTSLPNNYSRSAIYLREEGFLAIVLYSAEGDKDYITAELGIQLTYEKDPPTIEELSSKESRGRELDENESVVEINGWPVFLDTKAYGDPSEKFREKYGTYIVLAYVWIDKIKYTISSPTINGGQTIDLIKSMVPKN